MLGCGNQLVRSLYSSGSLGQKGVLTGWTPAPHRLMAFCHGLLEYTSPLRDRVSFPRGGRSVVYVRPWHCQKAGVGALMTLQLRFAEPKDAEQIRDIYAPIVEHTATSFESSPPTVDEVRRRISTTLNDLPWLVAEEEGRVAGYSYAGRFRDRPAYLWTAEASVYVQAEYRRRGVAAALYTAMFECLRLQGFYNVIAVITLPNAASVGLHEKLGFRPVGVFRSAGFKLGQWRDVAWYQCPLRPPAPNPEPPVPRSSVAPAKYRDVLSHAAAIIGRG